MAKLSIDIESLFGDQGVLYSEDSGFSWWVKYKHDAFPIPLVALSKKINTKTAYMMLENCKDSLLLSVEKNGARLLAQQILPGDEWKH